MIIGAHIMIQSRNDKADQAFMTKVLKLDSVDAGDGFLLFGIPPAEVAIHAGDGKHEMLFMCDDIQAFVADMKKRKVACTAPANRGWGTVTEITLPGGGKLGVYQPHHPRPKARGAKCAAAKRTAKKKSVKRPAPRKKTSTRARR